MSQEIAEKIRAAAQARGLDPELAVSIARAESSLNPSAKAAKSSASGLFQVTTDTWKQYKGAPGKQFDPDENIRVGMDIIADNMGSLRTALGREPRPAEVYAAHYFGPAGARSVLAAQPDTPIGDILSKRAIAANPNLKGKTVGAVLAQLEGKVGSSAVAAAPVVVQPDVSKPAVAPAAAAGEPGGRVVSRETGQEPAARLASLGPGYQAALALSFLADEDEKEERDLDRDPSISQQWLAQQASRPTGLALSDISIRSPFAAQEPVRMNEGGEVESKASRLLKELVPMDVRVFGSTLLGNREPLTEKSFTEQELAAMQQAVDTAVKRTGQAQKGSVQYEDYPKGEAIGPGYQPVGQTLGRFTYEKTPDGRTVITDRYDFYNEGRRGNVERYEKMGRGERAASVSASMLKNLLSGDFRGVPGELADAYIGRQGRDVRINLPPVKRAEGSPEEGERLTPQQIERIAQLEAQKREEAEKPAFLTPKSGIGRKISTKPGELELAAVQGMSELPYLLAGAPVDLATMAMRPFGYDVERPMLGSEDLKERALRAGIRQEPPKGEAARALYSMAELGASAVNPAAPVRGAVAAAQKTGEAAKMLARDFQQYNRQLDVPGASYAVRNERTTSEPFFQHTPSAETPFVGRLDEFVAGMQAPVQKEQFLGMLKGRFRDYDIARAQAVLDDLPPKAKITPSDLLNRLKSQYDPSQFKTTVLPPKPNSYYQNMDNIYSDRPLGVIHMSQGLSPAVDLQMLQTQKAGKALDWLVSRQGRPSVLPNEEVIQNLLITADNSALPISEQTANGIRAVARDYQVLSDEYKQLEAVQKKMTYPILDKNWSAQREAYITQLMEANPGKSYWGAAEEANAMLTKEYAEEGNRWLASRGINPVPLPNFMEMDEPLLYSMKDNEAIKNNISAAFDDAAKPILDRQKEISERSNNLRSALKDETRSIAKYTGQHSSLGNIDNPISFSRFSEHTTDIPGIGKAEGIYVNELQSDRLDDIRKLGPKGGSMQKDRELVNLLERGLDNLVVKIRQAEAAGDTAAVEQLRNQHKAMKSQLFRVDSRLLNVQRGENTYQIPESFVGMENAPQVVQQLMVKNAISGAIQMGKQFVAFPGKESAQAQLYEKLGPNLKAVVKDLGPGFEVRDVTLRDPSGMELMHRAIVWGPEAAARLQKKGVPFKAGGLVERTTADNRKYL